MRRDVTVILRWDHLRRRHTARCCFRLGRIVLGLQFLKDGLQKFSSLLGVNVGKDANHIIRKLRKFDPGRDRSHNLAFHIVERSTRITACCGYSIVIGNLPTRIFKAYHAETFVEVCIDGGDLVLAEAFNPDAFSIEIPGTIADNVDRFFQSWRCRRQTSYE